MTARHPITPRGLCRVQAAEYIGVGTTKFDQMVLAGIMPQPRVIDARRVWDRFELDDAFEALPKSDPRATAPNPFDEIRL